MRFEVPTEPVLTVVIAIITLLLVAAVSAIGLKRIHLPFTVGLVLVGLLLGFLADRVDFLEPLREIELSPDLILFVFLPTLIFESAYNLDGRLLGKNVAPVLLLAGPGLVLSTGIVGGLILFLTPLTLGPALLFGALISATDPIAVVALFKDVGAPKRLGILVEGESLFNDATAIVLFSIVLAVVLSGSSTTASTIVGGLIDFVVVFAGGLLVGNLIGGGVLASLRWAEDSPVVEVTISTVAAYAAFIVADHYLGVSGVMATLGAGLVIGTFGATRFTPETKVYLHRFWEYAAFVANSLIFLLVGLSVSIALLREHILFIALAVVAVLIGRGATVFGLVPLTNLLPKVEEIGRSFRMILFVGGLRGAVALALVLSLPSNFPNRELLLALTVGVVLASLLGGGLATGPLIRHLGLDRPDLVTRVARAQTTLAAKQEALQRVGALHSAGHYSSNLLRRLQRDYTTQVADARAQVDSLQEECEADPDLVLRVLWSEALTVERSAYRHQFDRGVISEPVLRELELSIDLQRDELGAGRQPTVYARAEPFETRVLSWLAGAASRIAPRSEFVEHYRRRTLAARYEQQAAIYEACTAVAAEIDGLAELSRTDPALAAHCRKHYEERATAAMNRLDDVAEHFPEYVRAVQRQTIRRMALDAEADAVEGLAEKGVIPEGVAQTARGNVVRAYRALSRQPLEALEPNPADLLKQIPMFAQLGPEEFSPLATAAVPRTVLAGETIIRQGERGNSLYLIARGVVGVFISQDGAPPKRVASLFAGDFFGEMALLADAIRTATVRAASDCRLFELAKPDVERLYEVCPNVKTALEQAAQARSAPWAGRGSDVNAP